MTTRAAAAAVALACLASGCIDDLPQAKDIDDTRVLAGRVEVQGDEARAWPAPGETATVTWLVADPTEMQPLSWSFFVCPAFVSASGEAFCTGAPFAFDLVDTPVDADPTITFTVPTAGELGGLTAVQLQGVICADGTPEIDMSGEVPDVRCVGSDGPRLLVQFTIFLADLAAGVSNLNPTILDTQLTFDGEPWLGPAAPPPATGCAAMAGTPDLPLRAIGDPKPVIGYILNEDDREEYLAPGDVPSREDQVFYSFSTLGTLERSLTVLDDAVPVADQEWDLPRPENVTADGTLIRFFHVLRDQRGGTDWVTRYACITSGG